MEKAYEDKLNKEIIVVRRRKTRLGTRTHLVLEILKEGMFTTAEILLNEFVNEPTVKEKYIRALYPQKINKKKKEIRISRNTRIGFYNTLLRLEKQGLIEKNKKGRWGITKNGKEEIKAIEKREPKQYVCKDKKSYTIIAFDIPERKRDTRDWLRGTLIEMGFSLLQQSVWIGNKSVPREFLEDLEGFGILNNVHIFEVTKGGTI